jgi:hypothetical protein
LGASQASKASDFAHKILSIPLKARNTNFSAQKYMSQGECSLKKSKRKQNAHNNDLMKSLDGSANGLEQTYKGGVFC